MLRGCALCILVTASAALGFVLSQRLSKRLGQLKILKRMTLFLHGEISCARVPLPEAFWSVGGKVPEPFREFLREVSEDLGKYAGSSLGQVFAEHVDCHLRDTSLTQEDRARLKELGDSLGYLDKAMQLANLEAYSRELDLSIEELTEGLPAKKKLFRSLGLMGGLFLAILLF